MSPAVCRCGCGTPIWRTVRHQKTGQEFLLWPDPTALFAQAWAGEGVAVGLGYRAACAPPLGQDASEELVDAMARATQHPVESVRPMAVIMGYEDARTRYAARMSDDYGVWLRAWLEQEIGLGEVEIAAVLRRWEEDRA